MLDINLNELVTPEQLDAFARMWNTSREDAEAEARQIILTLAELTDAEKAADKAAEKPLFQEQKEAERRALLAKVVLSLVGDAPDLASWLEAIAVGSFELRPEQNYAYSTELKARARLLNRQQANLDLIEPLRRKWASDVDANQDGVRLIAASALAKELRKNVAAKAALGPAWPLMVAIDKHFSADEKELLHRFGASEELIGMIARVVRLVLNRFVRLRFPQGLPARTRSAEWKRTIPPGVDVKAYFASRNKVQEDVPPTVNEVIAQVLAGPMPSFIAEIEQKLPWHISRPIHFDHLLPTRPVAADGMFAKAIRALARERYREQLIAERSPFVGSEDFLVQVWLRKYAEEGGPIPPSLPVRYLGYLEEEACLAFETHGREWPGFSTWLSYRVIAAEPTKLNPRSLGSYYTDQGPDVTWVAPTRKVDRIEI